MRGARQFIKETRKLVHSYREQGYFRFVGSTLSRIVFLYLVAVSVVILLEKFLLDFNKVYAYIFEKFSDGEVIATVLISETIIGLFPPEIFMVWTSKFNHPIIMLCILGMVAYIGGIIAYVAGYWLRKRPKIRSYIEKKLEKQITLTRKWGGAFIVVAAVFPFTPYAAAVVAVSLLKYPFSRFLIFGLFRILRFIVQGVILLKIVNF